MLALIGIQNNAVNPFFKCLAGMHGNPFFKCFPPLIGIQNNAVKLAGMRGKLLKN